MECPFNSKQLSFIKLCQTNSWKYLMLLVICKIIGKTHVFQLCNLNHTFSPTYLYIYQINELREKSHYAQRSFCVCVFFYGKKFLTCVKFNSKAIFLCSLWNFFRKFHRHYLASDISILSFNLFKKIVLASQSQGKPSVIILIILC